MHDEDLLASPHLYEVFLHNTQEHLERIEQQALLLEQSPADLSLIDALFRSFHTIKGDAGTHELAAVQQVTHSIEGLLEDLRSGKYPPSPPVITVVLEAADFLKALGPAPHRPARKPLPEILTAIAAVREHGGGQLQGRTGMTVLHLSGPLDLEATDQLSRQLLQIRDQGGVRIVLDLQEVTSICSTALGCLAATVLDLRKKGGDLKLVHVHGDVLLKLQITKLTDVFQLFDDEYAAVKSF